MPVEEAFSIADFPRRASLIGGCARVNRIIESVITQSAEQLSIIRDSPCVHRIEGESVDFQFRIARAILGGQPGNGDEIFIRGAAIACFIVDFKFIMEAVFHA